MRLLLHDQRQTKTKTLSNMDDYLFPVPLAYQAKRDNVTQHLPNNR